MKTKAKLVKESLSSRNPAGNPARRGNATWRRNATRRENKEKGLVIEYVLIPDDYHGAPVVELETTTPYTREEIGNISTGASYGVANADFDDDFLQQFSPNPELYPKNRKYEDDEEYDEQWEDWWENINWDEVYLQVNYLPIFKYAYSIKFLDGKIPPNIEEILNRDGDLILYDMFFTDFSFNASEKPESDVQRYIDSISDGLKYAGFDVIVTAKGPQTFISS